MNELMAEHLAFVAIYRFRNSNKYLIVESLKSLVLNSKGKAITQVLEDTALGNG